MLPAWMRQLKAKLVGCHAQLRGKGTPRRIRLTLETLEDRITPAEVLGPTLLSVTSALDPAALTPGTLRYALSQANQDAAAGNSDTIVFNVAQMGSNTITLTQGPLELTEGTGTVMIDGGGQVAIDGNKSGAIFSVDAGAQAVLNGLTIQDGSVGGILNDGTLTVSNATISGNSSNFGGGGINNGGMLTVTNCTITNNSAVDGGGGISNGNAYGLPNDGTMTVSNSTISNNSSELGGGGISNSINTIVTVNSCTIAGNSSDGGIDNSSGSGGGIENYGDLTVTNSTIADNSASVGGGIDSSSYAGLPGVTTLLNTIVAGNTATSRGQDPDVAGNVSANSSHNLIGDGDGLSGISNGDANGNQVGSSNNPINPLLGPLSNNGGATQTFALLPGSPAIGAGAAVTSLAGAITSPTSTSITVADASAIASTPGNYVIQSDGEQMLVTNVDLSTNTLTVIRGYNDTTATEHSTGAGVLLATDQRGQASSDPPDIGSCQSQSAVASFVVSVPSEVVAGVGFPVTITAVDQEGHPVSGYNGSVTLTSSDGQHISPILTPGHGLGPELRPFAVTLANGVATTTIYLDEADNTTLQAYAAGITGSSNAIKITTPRLVVSSEPPSMVTAGSPFNITVEVEDGFGNVVTNYTGPVSISLVGQGGSSTPKLLDTVRATAGVAVFSGLSIDTAGSGYALQVTAGNVNLLVGVTAANTNSFSVTPAVPQQLAIVSQPSTSITAGTPFGVTMKVEDAFGNLVQNYNGPVSVTLAGNAGNGVLQGTTTVMAQNGVATFSGLTVDKTGSGYVLQGRLNNQATGTSNGFSITPAAATHLAIWTPPPSSVTAGNPFGLTVVAEDAFGNVATSYAGPISLTLTRSSSNAKLQGVTTVWATAGVASFSNLSVDMAGSGYVLQATGTSVSGELVSGEISYWSGNGTANDSIGGNNGVASPGSNYTSGLVGQAFDFTAPGDSVKAPANNLPTGNASRTLDVWVRLDAPVPANGEAFFAGYGNFGSFGATFQLGATSQNVFFSQWGSAILGPALQIGKWYNVAATYNGSTVTLYLNGQAVSSSSNLTINTPTGSSFYIGSPDVGARQLIGAAQGVAVFNRALSSAEIQSLYQTGPQTSGSVQNTLTAANTNRFIVTPAAPHQLAIISQPPASMTAGTSFGVTMKVEDAFGNLVQNYNGPVSVTLAGNGGNAVLQGTTTVTAHNGVATFSGLKVDKVGSGYVLQGQLNNQTMGSSNSFSVTPAAATHLAISTPPPSNVTVGSLFRMTVAAEDAFGNVITNYNGPITLTLAANPGGSTLGGTVRVNATNGVAAFSALTLNELGNGYTLKASSGYLATATTSPFTVVPRLVFTQLPSSVIAGQTFTAYVQVQDGQGKVVTSYNGPITLGTNSYGIFGNTSQIRNGRAIFTGLEATIAATGYQLQAHAGNLTAVSPSFTVRPGAATQLVITASPPSVVTAGSPFSLTATLEDAYGNVVPYTGSASVVLATNPASSNSESSLQGTTTINGVNGMATFNNLSLRVQTSGYTIRATMDGFTATTSSIQVVAAAPSYVFLATPNLAVKIGGSVAIVGDIMDKYGNVVINYTDPMIVNLWGPTGHSTSYKVTRISVPGGVGVFNVTLLGASSSDVSIEITSASGSLRSAQGTLHVVSTSPSQGYEFLYRGSVDIEYDDGSDDTDDTEFTYYAPNNSALSYSQANAAADQFFAAWSDSLDTGDVKDIWNLTYYLESVDPIA